MAGRKATPLLIDPQSIPAVNASKRQKRRRPPKAAEFQRYTIQEAFAPYLEDTGELSDNFDVERSLRSVALLMHSLSQIGNRPVDGFIVHGLAAVLDDYADQLGYRGNRNAKP